ncbi:MAG: DUF2330 domain-containing protein [Archangium sp.]|nr:DUF2330 domain-containing protein [Archangium sp.]
MIAVILSLLAIPAHAFCGFYVSSAGGQLFNDATSVTLMRDGTRTVLSMQNNYRGPAEDFAMVVPVPVILQKENVRTLQKSAFERIDAIASPRLVEMYTDQVPCAIPAMAMMDMEGAGPREKSLPKDLGVKVEAQFSVNEYDIVILSAKDALGLDIWLKENKYKIPNGAEPLLRPYVQNNSKFFVAKVNAKKVTFTTDSKGNKIAVLSPLRFHYDSEKFELPVRLGLMNSSGEQDLIVHIIARGRYEVANRPNVFVPTNLDVKVAVQPVFGAFYSDLVAKTFEKNKGAALTEFAWQGALPPPQVMIDQGIYGVTCDPCPPPHPADDPLARNLGADVMPGVKTDSQVAKFAQEATVTRLHLRYTKESLTDDLVFKLADPIHGGVPQAKATEPAKTNRFQGRYIMWKKGGNCSYGGFGGPGGIVSGGLSGTNAVMASAAKLTQPFPDYLVTDIPELGIVATGKPPPPEKQPKK